MKNVLIDATTLSDQFKNRGVGRYTFEVITRLVQDKSTHWHIICFDEFIQEVSINKKLKHFEANHVFLHSIGKMYPSSYSNLWKFNKLFSLIIKQVNPDVYFSPQFERGIPKKHDGMKIVSMIHDIIPIKTNMYSRKSKLHNFVKSIFYKYQFKKIRHADIILTHTDFSKREIINYTNIPEDKVDVIYLGIQHSFRVENISKSLVKKIKNKYNLNRPYILYYGGFEESKNVESLVKAFVKFQKTNVNNLLVIVTPDLEILNDKLVAKNEKGVKIAGIINKADIIDYIRIVSTVPDNELAGLLTGANIFMHLSEYEGFGLSVAESLAAGTPTIIANSSCYPELFQNTSKLVLPKDIEAIVQAIGEVTSDTLVRARLIDGGLKLAKKLDWDNTAKETWEHLTENKSK